MLLKTVWPPLTLPYFELTNHHSKSSVLMIHESDVCKYSAFGVLDLCPAFNFCLSSCLVEISRDAVEGIVSTVIPGLAEHVIELSLQALVPGVACFQPKQITFQGVITALVIKQKMYCCEKSAWPNGCPL